MPRRLSENLVREVPVLSADQDVRSAVRALREHDLPALPVVDADGRYCGVFGQREFVTALFPGYLSEIKYAGFVPHSLDTALEERSACLADRVGDHCNREHIDVGEDYSDAALAETFLHHRTLIVPVVDADRRVKGVITRSDFFDAVVERLDAA